MRPGLPVALLLICGCYPEVALDESAWATNGTGGDSGSDDEGGGAGSGDGDGGGDSGDGSDDGGGEGSGDGGGSGVVLEAIEPAHGSTDGGRELILTGEGLSADATVFFGESSTTVSSLDDEGAVVVHPASDATGLVDVRVEQETGEATLPEAFTYWQDATDQAIATVSWIHFVDGGTAWWGDSHVQAEAHLFDPADLSPADFWVDEVGSCTLSGPEATAVEGPETVTIALGDGQALSLEADGAGSWSTRAEAPEDYVVGATLAVEVEEAHYPALGASELREAPPVFTSMTPDLVWWGSGSINADDPTIQWYGSSGDLVYIELQDLDSGDTVRCLSEDDGAFTIPDGALEAFEWEEGWWSTSVELWVMVATLRADATIQDFDSGELRSLMGYGVAGLVEFYVYD